MPDTVLVGFGRAHRALLPVLLREGADLGVIDQRPWEALDDEARALLMASGVVFVGGPDYLRQLETARRIFLTPGMRKDLPEIAAARARGAEITGEAAYVFARLPKETRTIGITGSAGKTTTTTLVGRLLADQGFDVEVAGNIGRPLAEVLEAPPAYLVAELSSFQLELFQVGPQIGAILNFQPNHLDVHGSLHAYWQAKLRLVATAPEGAPIVVPGDDERLQAAVVAQGRKPVTFAGPFGQTDPSAAVVDGRLVLRTKGTDIVVLPEVTALRIPGAHNVRNVLAAVLLAFLAGARPEAMAATLTAFTGVPHRLECVAEIGGVRYVNDSIATAPDRTLAALQALPGPIIWIAGGYDKGLDYDGLEAALQDVKVCLTMGPTAEKIERVTGRAGVRTIRVENLAAAVELAARLARPGDTVLLSPASASYDQFANFEARGQAFRELVYRLGGESPAHA